MEANLDCIDCIIQKAGECYEKHNPRRDGKLVFMKKVFSLIGGSSLSATAPYLSKRINDLMREEFGETADDYAPLKSRYNRLMAEQEGKIQGAVNQSGDPLLSALQYAMVGNLIDFAALSDVSPEKLYALLGTASSQKVDPVPYRAFRSDLENAENLVYLLDNAGEIICDKILMKTIGTQFPRVHITAVVRGAPVFNDVTLADARETGLTAVADVVGNGTDIPGTQLELLGGQAKKAVEEADLMVSKGQGNFETLYGCGKNIYYIFLCKCSLFVRRFGIPKFSGVFANERRINFKTEF